MGAGVLLIGWLAMAPADIFRPEEQVLGFTPAAILARFVHSVTAREELRSRVWAQWTREFKREADAITRRFKTEEDWRPAYADAALLVERFLLATNLPRKGEWPAAGVGCVNVEVLDRSGGDARRKVELRCGRRRTDTLLAPKDDPGKALEDVGRPPATPTKGTREQPKPGR